MKLDGIADELREPHGITSYQVHGDVCPDHHDLITYKGYTVIENDDGCWSLRAPPDEAAA